MSSYMSERTFKVLSRFCASITEHHYLNGSNFIFAVDRTLVATSFHNLIEVTLTKDGMPGYTASFPPSFIHQFGSRIPKENNNSGFLTTAQSNKRGLTGSKDFREYDIRMRKSRFTYEKPGYKHLIPNAISTEIRWEVAGDFMREFAAFVNSINSNFDDDGEQIIAIGIDRRTERLFVVPDRNKEFWVSVPAGFEISDNIPDFEVELIARLNARNVSNVLDFATSIEAKAVKFSQTQPVHWPNAPGADPLDDSIGVKAPVRFDIQPCHGSSYESVCGVITPVVYSMDEKGLWEESIRNYRAAT